MKKGRRGTKRGTRARHAKGKFGGPQSPATRKATRGSRPRRSARSRAARSAAAYRGQITKLKNLLAKAEAKAAKKKKRKVSTVTVGALVLYEVPTESAAPVFVEWEQWPVRATVWELQVQLLVEGRVEAETTLRVAAEWSTEPASRMLRRELRAWYDQQLIDHPQWRESPQAAAIHLSLRDAGAER